MPKLIKSALTRLVTDDPGTGPMIGDMIAPRRVFSK
jgi:hypothetical protein